MVPISKTDLIRNIKKTMVNLTSDPDLTECKTIISFRDKSIVFMTNNETFPGKGSRLAYSLVKGKCRIELRKMGYKHANMIYCVNDINFNDDTIRSNIYFTHQGEKKHVIIDV